jgi:alkanesulfonate monooxygenase SsuD/methylene tetrahydromethanopterin reductase-like flavin-dependent oxidoreductase (luciferase family)
MVAAARVPSLVTGGAVRDAPVAHNGPRNGNTTACVIASHDTLAGLAGPMRPRSFGLIIPQRAAMFGVSSLPDLLRLAAVVDQEPLFDTVWVGDSLTSKARAESLSCLGALAGMTERVRLAVGCMASFPVRDPALFAYQWASLDEVSQGRMLLAVCNGLQKRDGASEKEGGHFGQVADKHRAARLEEFMDLVRELWTGKPVTFHGRFADYEEIQILPRPVQDPCPIWISANPPAGPMAERVYRRVATKSDGLLSVRSAEGYVSSVRTQLDEALHAAGRDPGSIPLAVYHSVNIGPDREKCLDEAQRFMDLYYGEGTFGRETVSAMTATGTVDECIDQLRSVQDEGADHVALRIASWSQREQLDQLIEHVLPGVVA